MRETVSRSAWALNGPGRTGRGTVSRRGFTQAEIVSASIFSGRTFAGAYGPRCRCHPIARPARPAHSSHSCRRLKHIPTDFNISRRRLWPRTICAHSPSGEVSGEDRPFGILIHRSLLTLSHDTAFYILCRKTTAFIGRANLAEHPGRNTRSFPSGMEKPQSACGHWLFSSTQNDRR